MSKNNNNDVTTSFRFTQALMDKINELRILGVKIEGKIPSAAEVIRNAVEFFHKEKIGDSFDGRMSQDTKNKTLTQGTASKEAKEV